MKAKKRRNLIFSIVIVVVVVVALGLLLYPSFANWMNNMNAQYMVSSYNSLVSNLTEDEIAHMLSDAEEYNEEIYETGSAMVLTYPDMIDGYDDLLSPTEAGIMGYLTIPSIDLQLPIYHGTTDEVMNIGVGHLKGSSLPVGGENTHAVLSTHNGLPSAKLFTDLDKMEIGDYFRITVLNKELVYQVYDIEVVEPDATEELLIVDGEDIVTLTTCTPYGINTDRLVVRGERVLDPPKEALESLDGFKTPFDWTPVFLVLALLFVIALIVFLVITSKKYNRKLEAEEQVEGNKDDNLDK